MNKIHLNLEDIEANYFVLMLVFEKQALKQGWSKATIEAVLKEAKNGDYDHILKTLKKYCIPPLEEDNN
ncbi:hypothetical protein [Flavivirga jejuensis]|uniref:Uncharacterized protein n=1 Tax=Flavivirga jejuensis TaxID=870487 RepID=A0ABT8WPM1_9FLAO|nr:hypothetical protein [Flavivirga jejuensis]MDO5974934.1 hypothetical protein [Flavivirga jejuensis]